MNPHTFGNHSVTCPVCQSTRNLKKLKKCNGLYMCPYCQERLVVTWSGHYVRDPHTCKQVAIAHQLRRQSRPWARTIRDFGFIKRPSVIVAVGSAILLGISLISLESLNRQQQPLQEVLDQAAEIVNPASKPSIE